MLSNFFNKLYSSSPTKSAFENFYLELQKSTSWAKLQDELTGFSDLCFNHMTKSQWHFIEDQVSTMPQELISLDIGCGSGHFFKLFENRLSKCSIGIDQSETALSLAKKRLPQFEYIKSEIQNIKVNRSFDLIISIDGFYNLNNYKNIMTSLIKLKKINGKIIIPFTQTNKSLFPKEIEKIKHPYIKKDFTEEFSLRWKLLNSLLEGPLGIKIKSESKMLYDIVKSETETNLNQNRQRNIYVF